MPFSNERITVAVTPCRGSVASLMGPATVLAFTDVSARYGPGGRPALDGVPLEQWSTDVVRRRIVFVEQDGAVRATGTHGKPLRSDKLYRDLVAALRIATTAQVTAV